MKRFLALAILALVLSGSAQAQIDLRLDLSESAGGTPGNWNNIADANLNGLTPNLIDFNTGLGTGVSIDGTGSNWDSFVGDEAGEFPNQSWLIQPATQDGAGLADGETGVFTVSGLPGSAYVVEIVSARTQFNYQNFFSVNGNVANRTFLGTPVESPWESTSDGLTPGNWLIWDNVVPVGGTITISHTAGSTTLGILNAVRIVQVAAVGAPEPTAIALFGIGIAGLLVVRRKSRR